MSLTPYIEVLWMDVEYKAMPAGAEEYQSVHEDLILFGRPVSPIALKLNNMFFFNPT